MLVLLVSVIWLCQICPSSSAVEEVVSTLLFFVPSSNPACIQYISLSTPTLSQLNLDIISDFEYSTFVLYPVTKQSSTHDIHNINPLQYQIKKTRICLDFLIIYIIECLQSFHPECKCSFFQSIICLSGTITNNRHLDRTY